MNVISTRILHNGDFLDADLIVYLSRTPLFVHKVIEMVGKQILKEAEHNCIDMGLLIQEQQFCDHFVLNNSLKVKYTCTYHAYSVKTFVNINTPQLYHLASLYVLHYWQTIVLQIHSIINSSASLYDFPPEKCRFLQNRTTFQLAYPMALLSNVCVCVRSNRKIDYEALQLT